MRRVPREPAIPDRQARSARALPSPPARLFEKCRHGSVGAAKCLLRLRARRGKTSISPVEDIPGCGHIRPMLRRETTALAIAVVAMSAFGARSPLQARTDGNSVISGSCQYPEPVARQAAETTLIVCDTATLSLSDPAPALDFGQREWGSIARFTGDMADNRMTVSGITLRDGTRARRPAAARSSTAATGSFPRSAAWQERARGGSRPTSCHRASEGGTRRLDRIPGFGRQRWRTEIRFDAERTARERAVADIRLMQGYVYSVAPNRWPWHGGAKMDSVLGNWKVRCRDALSRCSARVWLAPPY